MKIGLTCPASLPATQFGGIMFLCLDIAKKSANLGHDVTIYTTDMDFANNPFTFNKKLPRKEKFEKFIINRSHVWFSIYLFFVNPGIYFQMMKDDNDIIHSIGVKSFQSFIATLVSKKKKIPLIISDQGGLTTHPDLHSSLSRRIAYKLQTPMVRYVVNQATKIIVANEYEKQIFLNKEMGVEESKITIIRNGINLDILDSTVFDFKKKYKIKQDFLLFIGRFSRIKGIDILLKTINLLKNNPEILKIKFIIMGVDFGFESQMFSMIKRFNVEDKILVIKNPPREDVIQAYRECKFLILPSRWELSPLTPLEGFAFKKTVVSTSVYGIPYTLEHNKNSLLVHVENPESLSAAILELINDSKKCEKFGNNGYELVVNTCNATKMVENTLKIYEAVLKH